MMPRRRFRLQGRRGAAAGARALALLIPVTWAMVGQAAPVAGQGVFHNDCAPCHGSRGEGGIGPQLAGRPWTDPVVTTHVRQGGLVMPAFSARQITDAQLQGLIAYLNGLPAPASTAQLPAPAAKAPGAGVFEARCQACHGAEARGGLAPGILNTSLPLTDFLRQVRQGGGIMPPFPAAQLSDADAQGIYAYLHPPLPRPDPGTVVPLPSVPDYPGEFFFALAVLAVLAQLGSERRRRVRLRLRAEEEIVRAQLPMDELEGVQVRVF